MGKLIRLEWKKNKVSKYILGAAILMSILAAFLFAQCYLGIANDAATGRPDSAPGMETMAPQIELFTNLSFLIFTAVMLSSFAIAPYKNKTMNLMFTYPVRRRNIVLAQILSVWIFCFAALLICKLFIFGLLYLLKGSMHASFALGYRMDLPGFYLQLVMKSFVSVTLGFISLFAGRVMKSSKAAIITAFLLFVVMNGTVGDFSFKNNMAVPVILTAVSLVCVSLTVCGVETKDLM